MLTLGLVNQCGQTPLHLAVDKGREAVVGALLKAGADKDAKDKVSGGRVLGQSWAVRCDLNWFGLIRNGMIFSRSVVYVSMLLLPSELERDFQPSGVIRSSCLTHKSIIVCNIFMKESQCSFQCRHPQSSTPNSEPFNPKLLNLPF